MCCPWLYLLITLRQFLSRWVGLCLHSLTVYKITIPLRFKSNCLQEKVVYVDLNPWMYMIVSCWTVGQEVLSSNPCQGKKVFEISLPLTRLVNSAIRMNTGTHTILYVGMVRDRTGTCPCEPRLRKIKSLTVYFHGCLTRLSQGPAFLLTIF